jgi:hypothetical protein
MKTRAIGKAVGLLAVLVIFAMSSGCTQRVPPGYIGMVMKPGGLTGEILAPGNHTCYGRDKMVLVEMAEITYTEKLKVLCKDDLNMSFDLKVRARLRTSAGKDILAVLNRQGSSIQWKGDTGVLGFGNLYATYVKGPARSLARGHISKYQTTDIRADRKAIEKAIKTDVLKASKGTPIEITMVVTSNLDYPEVITRAMESKREREIKIGEERAKQAMELLKADNRLKVAQKMKITRAAEAEAEAIYNKLMASSLTDKYLQLRAIETRLALYSNPNKDKIVITGAATPLVNVQ